jgi:hypothetical protein
MKKVILSVAITTVLSICVNDDVEAWIFSRNNATTRSEITAGFGASAVNQSKTAYEKLNNAYSALKTVISKTEALIKLIKSYASSIPGLDVAIEGCNNHLKNDKNLLNLVAVAMKDVYQCERDDVMYPKIVKALNAAGSLFTGIPHVATLIRMPLTSITANQAKIEKAKEELISAYNKFANYFREVEIPYATHSITDESPTMIKRVEEIYGVVRSLKNQVISSETPVQVVYEQQVQYVVPTSSSTVVVPSSYQSVPVVTTSHRRI